MFSYTIRLLAQSRCRRHLVFTSIIWIFTVHLLNKLEEVLSISEEKDAKGGGEAQLFKGLLKRPQTAAELLTKRRRR
jgi:hypothetical protein